MKRDNQNKSIDTAICEKLYRIAEEVLDFESTDVVVDNYQKGEYDLTASDIIRGKTASGCGVTFLVMDETECYKGYAIEAGTFKLSFPAYKVFDMIAHFEKLAGCTGKKAHHFTRNSEEAKYFPIKGKTLETDYNDMTAKCRKKDLMQVTSHTAFRYDKKTGRYYIYYRADELWYYVGEASSEYTLEMRCSKIEPDGAVWDLMKDLKLDDTIYNTLSKWDRNPVLKALYDVLKPRYTNHKAA